MRDFVLFPGEKWLAYLGRRWGYSRGVRFFNYLRKLAAKYYRDRPNAPILINDYDGNIKMRVDRSAYIGSLVYWHGGQPTYEFNLLRQILRPNMVMIDVGANQGEATLIAAKRLTKGRVIAFEPVPELFEQLSVNLRLNQMENVLTFCCALSFESGVLPIYTSMDLKIHSSWNEGLASLYKSDYRNTLIHNVPVDTMDAIVARIGLERIDLIKIDVEGAERDVLLGSQETLKHYRPKIIMEINPTALTVAGSTTVELINLLESLNYRINVIDATGGYHQLNSSNECDYCDVYCEPIKG